MLTDLLPFVPVVLAVGPLLALALVGMVLLYVTAGPRVVINVQVYVRPIPRPGSETNGRRRPPGVRINAGLGQT